MREELVTFIKEKFPIDWEYVKFEITQTSTGGYAIVYHTPYYIEENLAIFSFVNTPKYTSKIHSLAIGAEDWGANGTRTIDIQTLLEPTNLFENLQKITFPLNADNLHNKIVVTYKDAYDEEGGLGLLLDRCPNLYFLTTPSAPNEYFFKRTYHPLRYLKVQTGYDHQNFIFNLSQSECFPDLEVLHFRDYAETYMSDYKDYCTSTKEYEAFFLNLHHFPALRKITIQDSWLLKSTELKEAFVHDAMHRGIIASFI
jgi:hypothetical protein